MPANSKKNSYLQRIVKRHLEIMPVLIFNLAIDVNLFYMEFDLILKYIFILYVIILKVSYCLFVALNEPQLSA